MATTVTQKTPQSVVQIRDFRGMASYPDPHDVTPGAAQVQINVVSIRPGELRPRQGYKRAKFDS